MTGRYEAAQRRVSSVSAGPDFGSALERTACDGAAWLPGLLDAELCAALREEVAGGEYVALPQVQGTHRVRQQATHLVLTGTEIRTAPTVDALRRRIRAAVCEHAGTVGGAAEWLPDEVSVQRYEPGSTGISVHRDGKRYRYLVAIFTLEGTAPLRLCADRAGTTLRTVPAEQGSLVLLRGPGLGGVADGRPLHAVEGPAWYRRTSLTLRARPR